MKVPVFVPTWSLPQKARRGGVLGSRSPSTTALSFLYPRPRASAMLVPTWGLNCRCSWARRRWRWAFRFPNESPWASHWRRWFVLRVSQRRLRGLSTPAPDSSCLARPQSCLCFALSGAGRGLKVCSSCRRCVLRASNGFPARRGRRGRLVPPKTERGGFLPSKLGENLPRFSCPRQVS